jgi:predicted  nucleic acid-binding Zn-ribbon protein
MSIEVPISVGEFLDKLSILRIKVERISDPAKLENVRHETATLEEVWSASEFSALDLDDERSRLKAVNEALWEIEDDIRLKESRGEFDDEFIELARAVYVTNDRRAATIKEINLKTGSKLVGEKSYEEY